MFQFTSSFARLAARVFAVSALLLQGSLPSATAQVTLTEYPVPTGGPWGITSGTDGAIWYVTQDHPGGTIGRITPAGVITEFIVPTAGSNPGSIATGPDGNLWFTESGANNIGRMTLDGVFAEFPIPTADSIPAGIVAGPDGNMWFTEYAGNIGRITMDGGITEFPIPTPGGLPLRITVGPDGNLWFTETIGNKIGMITTAGDITEFPLPPGDNRPVGITTGPDGALWFCEAQSNQIGRITTSGVVMEFTVPAAVIEPFGITAGPDGNLWFAADTSAHICSVTIAGVITAYPVPTGSSRPNAIVTGPDGNLWFTEYTGNKIGKAVITPADTSPPTTTAALSGPSGANGWYTGAVQVTLTATDPDGPSDVAHTYFTADGGAQQTYSGPFTFSGDGIHTITYWSVDNAGNEEKPHPSSTIKIDSSAPSVTAAANPSILWPPNGKLVPVTVSGSMSDLISGIDPTGAVFSVVDDYGQVQPNGSITVRANGSYSFTVMLEAQRNVNDREGRHYYITVLAMDNAGNAASVVVTVLVPHDQGH